MYSKYPYLFPDFINLEISLSLGKGLFIRLSSKLGYLVISFVVSEFLIRATPFWPISIDDRIFLIKLVFITAAKIPSKFLFSSLIACNKRIDSLPLNLEITTSEKDLFKSLLFFNSLKYSLSETFTSFDNLFEAYFISPSLSM